MILIQNEQTFPIDIEQLQEHADTILKALDYADFDLGILLATPEVIHEYNRTYRDKDKATDILSFPFHDLKAGDRIKASTEDEKNLGDIIMCPQYIHDDLERWDMSFQDRIDVLLVHGICHLLGYDHIEDADYEVMKVKEAELLEKIKNR